MIGNDGVATEKEKDKDVLVTVSACMKPDEVQRYIDIAYTRFAKHGLLETAQDGEPLAALPALGVLLRQTVVLVVVLIGFFCEYGLGRLELEHAWWGLQT